MNYSVITIARTLGSGGEELGKTLAAEFGMRYVDGEIIDRAAELAGVTPGEVARAEARKGLIERIFENLARSGGSFEYPPAVLMELPGYEQLIVDVIRETAAAGNAVIVAHGAAIPLARMEGTLRVLVTASPETRAARLAAEAHGESRAKKMVEESDAARADFFRRFYKVDSEQATHYDLVINTDHLSVGDAAALIRVLKK
jgi:cytidylate kinase